MTKIYCILLPTHVKFVVIYQFPRIISLEFGSLGINYHFMQIGLFKNMHFLFEEEKKRTTLETVV